MLYSKRRTHVHKTFCIFVKSHRANISECEIYFIKRRFQASIFGSSNLANLNCLSEDGATGMSAWYVYTMRAATIRQSVGVCRVLYMYRRGLTALLILADGQCESLTSEISKNSSPRFFVMRT